MPTPQLLHRVQIVNATTRTLPRHLALPAAEKALWVRKQRGVLKRIAQRHRASRSLVSAAFWGRAFGPKAMRIHRAIDKAVFGAAAE